MGYFITVLSLVSGSPFLLLPLWILNNSIFSLHLLSLEQASMICAYVTGYWFLHCHFLYHIATGMAVVLQVGETSDFPTPPAGFPRCGSFTPEVYTN
jgi:hypothetical protein